MTEINGAQQSELASILNILNTREIFFPDDISVSERCNISVTQGTSAILA
jgi:hypothetical protein